MNKYIDVEKLIAEIERLKEETPIGICEYDKGEENGRMEVLTSLRSTITSLQQEQPEVDLEKEIKEQWKKWDDIITQRAFASIARHFYELGLNARKEE